MRHGSRSEEIDPADQFQCRTHRATRGAGGLKLKSSYALSIVLIAAHPNVAEALEQTRWTTLPITYGDNGRPIIAQSANDAVRLDAWVEESWWHEGMGHRDRFALGLHCLSKDQSAGTLESEYWLRIIAEGGSYQLRGSPVISAATESCAEKSLGKFIFSIGAWHGPINYELVECIAKDSEIVLASAELDWTRRFTLKESVRSFVYQ